jgi:hypothetical protein
MIRSAVPTAVVLPASTTGHTGPASRQDPGGHPPVGAVVPPAGDRHHPAPVGAAQQVEGGQGHGLAGPADQHVERGGLGGGGVDGVHLGDGEHRLHRSRRYGLSPRTGEHRPVPRAASPGPSATTTAMATWSVWVRERCHLATPAPTAS